MIPFRPPTAEELQESAERFAELAAKLEKGICVVCGVVIQNFVQEGRCIYSGECGHRVGQGKAKSHAKNVAEVRARAEKNESG